MRRLILLAALVIGSVMAADAYTTEGHVWSGSTVTYHVNPSSLSVSSDAALAAVQAAANVWNTQGGAAIALRYGGTTSATGLVLDYTNNVFFRVDAGNGYIAETYWWWDGSGRLVDADIVFNEVYPFGTNTVGCQGGYFIESVGAHEFGHVLGLGHSAVSTATMWPYGSACDPSFQTLDPDDIAGIQSLYPGGGSTGGKPPKGHGHK